MRVEPDESRLSLIQLGMERIMIIADLPIGIFIGVLIFGLNIHSFMFLGTAPNRSLECLKGVKAKTIDFYYAKKLDPLSNTDKSPTYQTIF